MKTHIIQLERHDDAISTRDKMMWGSSQRILLVFPEQGRILSRRVDMVLLQRHAQSLGAQLALVTTSTVVRQNALDVGVLVFKSVKQAQKSAWRVPLDIRRKFRRRPPKRPELNELRSRQVLPYRELPVGVRLAFFFIATISVLALVAFLLPDASIVLMPAEQEQRLSLELWANPSIQSPNLSGGIPAEVITVSVEGTETARSTGRTLIASRAAAGEVLFTSLTDRDVLVPVGTIVRTQSDPPIRFETVLSAVVKAEADEGNMIPVRAILPGSVSNILAGEIVGIEGSVGSQLAVVNLTGTSGGMDQTSPSPSSKDFEEARVRLLDRLSKQAEQALYDELPAGAYLLPPSLQLDEIGYEEQQPAAGEPADQLKLTIRATFSAWYLKDDDIRSAAEIGLDASSPNAYVQIPGTTRIRLLGEPYRRGSRIGYQVEAVRQLKAVWSREEVIRLVRGQDVMSAGNIIQTRYSLKSPPIFHIAPEWWPRLPYLPFRIKVSAQ
jgi:hypothetical protein